ncbi:MAG: thiamine phosphate synthase, partial [Pseudomonadota bacterium]
MAAALRGGARWLSLREKDLDHAERVALLAAMVDLGHRHGAAVTVHGDIEAALEAGADGVHLPSEGSPTQARNRLGDRALIGLSVHSGAEAASVDKAVDYVTLSPIYPTPSKPGYGPALGPAGVSGAVATAKVPIVALGGIGARNASDCLASGAAAVAVMGGVMAAA